MKASILEIGEACGWDPTVALFRYENFYFAERQKDSTAPFHPTNRLLVLKFFEKKKRDQGRLEAYITTNPVVDSVLQQAQPSLLVPDTLVAAPPPPFVPLVAFVPACLDGVDKINPENPTGRKKCGDCQQFYLNPRTHPVIQTFRHCPITFPDRQKWEQEQVPIRKARQRAKRNPDNFCQQCFCQYDNGLHTQLDERINVYHCQLKCSVSLEVKLLLLVNLR